MTWIAVLLGGALGSAARHGVNSWIARLAGTPAPYATATVNMIGSLVIGILAGALASQRLSMSATIRVFVFVGLIGGFTTFSSFVLDSLTLLQNGSPLAAAVNLGGQLVIGFALVWIGFQLGLH
jgi:fluoride exporter